MTLRAPLQTKVERRLGSWARDAQAAVTRNALLTVLNGQDQFFGPAGMGPSYNWPNPRGRSYHSSLLRWQISNLLETTLAPVSAAPFLGYVADNPRRPSRSNDLLQWQDWYREYENPPPGQGYWQMPARRARPVSLLTWTDPLKIHLQVAVAPPFSQNTWPVPQGRVPSVQLRTWTDPLKQLIVPDTTPDQFTFTDQTGVALSTVTTSAAVTIGGINAAAAITVTGGTYDINGSGTFVSTAGTVNSGDTVRARGTSSGSNLTTVNVVITIGGVSDTFSITTRTAGNHIYPYRGLHGGAVRNYR